MKNKIKVISKILLLLLIITYTLLLIYNNDFFSLSHILVTSIFTFIITICYTILWIIIDVLFAIYSKYSSGRTFKEAYIYLLSSIKETFKYSVIAFLFIFILLLSSLVMKGDNDYLVFEKNGIKFIMEGYWMFNFNPFIEIKRYNLPETIVIKKENVNLVYEIFLKEEISLDAIKEIAFITENKGVFSEKPQLKYFSMKLKVQK